MDMVNEKKQSGITEFIKSLLIIIPIAFVIRTFGFGLYQVPSGSMETTMLVGERFFADKFTPLFSPMKRGEIISFNDAMYNYSKNPVMRLFEHYVWGPMNVTKRIIGLPGEHVRGVVEDGKPVVYVNDKKLNEPYLNKYPLVAVPASKKLAKEHHYNMLAYLYAFIQKYPGQNPVMHRSYNATVPYEQQPFYQMTTNGVRMAAKVVEELGKHVQGQTIDNRSIKYPSTLLCPVKHMSYEGPRKQHYDSSDVFDVQLKDNEYWVMGDNRLGSADSRCFGPLDEQLIHGRIVFRILSIDTYDSWLIFDIIKHPIEFWSRVRWSRFFQFIS